MQLRSHLETFQAYKLEEKLSKSQNEKIKDYLRRDSNIISKEKSLYGQNESNVVFEIIIPLSSLKQSRKMNQETRRE